MTPESWVTLILGFGGGGVLVQGARLVFERRDGRDTRHRAEVDRATALAAEERSRRVEVEQQLEEAEREEERRARRERMALEVLSATRRVALDRGIPLADLPPVDLGGR